MMEGRYCIWMIEQVVSHQDVGAFSAGVVVNHDGQLLYQVWVVGLITVGLDLMLQLMVVLGKGLEELLLANLLEQFLYLFMPNILSKFDSYPLMNSLHVKNKMSKNKSTTQIKCIIYNNMIQSFDTKQTYMLIHSQTQHALQTPIQENYNKSSLELGPPNENNPKQMWILEDKGNYRYELILGYVDKVLTCDGDGVTLKRGTGDKSNQYWFIDTSISNKIKISKGKDTKKFLGLDKFRIVIRNNPPFELIDCWEFRKVTQNIDLNQSSFLKCMRTNKVMDVPESTSKQGVQICVWEPNYRFNQRWRIYRAGEVYIIKSFKTDLNLDITGEEYVDGNKLVQWHSTGGQNQFWRFQRKNKDTYRICSWVDTSLQIGHHNNKLIISKSQKFTWRVEGAFPEM